LLAHSLRLRRLDLYLQFERRLLEPELAEYRSLIGRRGGGQPVAYLLGTKEFMRLDFEVNPAVLVPNPDTEVLVLRAVAWARDRGGEVRVADVGTGSGCIAVALASYVPEVRVWASDDDHDALAVAGRNVRAHELTERVTLLAGDLLDPLPGDLDLICANLPYLTEGAELPPEVLAQPAHALFASGGGASLVRKLLRQAPSKLRKKGCVLVEIDEAIQEPVLEELPAYRGHRFHRDLRGQLRVLEASTQ
jgi:release factor glutamine methyltransferase